MARMLSKTLLWLAVAVSSVASAQKAGAPVKDKEEAQYDEIERGFHASVAAGYFALINPPASATSDQVSKGVAPVRPFSSGQIARVELGFDIGERLSLDLFAMATVNRAGSDYLGNSSPAGCETQGTCKAVSGDFSGFIPGATVKVNAVGFNDANDVKRLWIYLKAGGGYALFSPAGLVNSDVFLFGGPGVEYFTQLRHFTVGLEVVASFMLSGGTIGFAATPNLRYAF